MESRVENLLYELYRTNMAYEQQLLTSDIRSCIDHIISSGSILVLKRRLLKLTKKI